MKGEVKTKQIVVGHGNLYKVMEVKAASKRPWDVREKADSLFCSSAQKFQRQSLIEQGWQKTVLQFNLL